jgi:LAO/AO transport system kinase
LTPTTAACSAITNEVLVPWEPFKTLELTKGNNYFFEKRKEQNQYWMLETINEQLKKQFLPTSRNSKLLKPLKKRYKMMNFTFAAAQILEKYFKFYLNSSINECYSPSF